ncbi:uncharacterized protein LOC128667056 [Bombina bombina]|uniref:uncharacterized protein LOC128667056 n=1 Tax=Bombina bombina TaxID=8345 RepID=UPI00235B0FC4|nr:uncharacterized protein LOC128667056 [Bombina bombina]
MAVLFLDPPPGSLPADNEPIRKEKLLYKDQISHHLLEKLMSFVQSRGAVEERCPSCAEGRAFIKEQFGLGEIEDTGNYTANPVLISTFKRKMKYRSSYEYFCKNIEEITGKAFDEHGRDSDADSQFKTWSEKAPKVPEGNNKMQQNAGKIKKKKTFVSVLHTLTCLMLIYQNGSSSLEEILNENDDDMNALNNQLKEKKTFVSVLHTLTCLTLIYKNGNSSLEEILNVNDDDMNALNNQLKDARNQNYPIICYNYLFCKCQDGQPHSSGDLMEDNKNRNKQNSEKINKKRSRQEQYISSKEFQKTSKLDFLNQINSIGRTFKWLFLCLQLLLSIPVSTCGYHSLSYYHSGVSERFPGLPQFMAVGYIDDEQIDSYNSDTRELIPVTKWIQNNTDVSYWKRQTTYRRGWEEVFKEDLMILNGRFNHTEGLHTFQLMYGCGLDDDENTVGYYQYGYDGGYFIDLDLNRLLWVPYTNEAQISTQRWNREQHVANRVHSYLKNGCIKALKNYISLAGKERKVVPQVKVSGHQSDAVTKLHCRVYGFYPKAVDVKWVKNGEIDLMSEEATQVLPNPDGTYQLRVTVEVIPKDGDSFSCHVDHSSLKEPLTVLWEPKKTSPLNIAVVGSILPCVISAAVAGYFMIRKKMFACYEKKKLVYYIVTEKDSPCNYSPPSKIDANEDSPDTNLIPYKPETECSSSTSSTESSESSTLSTNSSTAPMV